MACKVETNQQALGIPTVVRIKRRLCEEPAETIVVSSKRKKIENDYSVAGIPSIILTKVATLKKEEKLECHLQRILQNEKKLSHQLKADYKKNPSLSVKDKVRKKVKADRSANFFKLTCFKRNIDLNGDENLKDLDINLYDASQEDQNATKFHKCNVDEDVITCNDEPMEKEKVDFVYDIYCTYSQIENSNWTDNICEIQKRDFDYLYEDDKSEESLHETDDENEEDNWRNDYPEEEDGEEGFSGDDEEEWDLCHRMKRTQIDSDESYDATDYDYSGHFDDGNQVLGSSDHGLAKLLSTYARRTKDSTSSEDEED